MSGDRHFPKDESSEADTTNSAPSLTMESNRKTQDMEVSDDGTLIDDSSGSDTDDSGNDGDITARTHHISTNFRHIYHNLNSKRLTVSTLDAHFKKYAFLRPMRKHLPHYVRKAREKMGLPAEALPVPATLFVKGSDKDMDVSADVVHRIDDEENRHGEMDSTSGSLDHVNTTSASIRNGMNVAQKVVQHDDTMEQEMSSNAEHGPASEEEVVEMVEIAVTADHDTLPFASSPVATTATTAITAAVSLDNATIEEDTKTEESMEDDVDAYTDCYSLGTLVDVASRTWPGINKAGGTGKITARRRDPDDPTGKEVLYSVTYMLGGTSSLHCFVSIS